MRATAIRNKIIRIIDFRKDEPDYFFSEKYKESWVFFLRKLILNRIFSQVQDISKKIIIKEPEGGPGASDYIAQCLPESKIIILIRDGRDIIDSLMDATRGEGFMSNGREITKLTPNWEMSFIKSRAEVWCALTENLMKTYENHPKNLVFLIKYEELRTNTKTVLNKLYQFLEIDIPENEIEKIVDKYTFENLPDAIKGKGKFHRSATPGKWKENFSKEKIELMNKIMGSTLKKLGYQLN